MDGCIGALFLDLLASSGAFTKKEADEVVQVRFAFLVTTPDPTQIGESVRKGNKSGPSV